MRVCIDMKRTGKHLKQLIMDAGYSVSDIQKFLELSCPQPVYRWYKGKALPTVDHLRILGLLLGKHMEELIVTNIDDIQELGSIELEAVIRETERGIASRALVYASRLCSAS